MNPALTMSSSMIIFPVQNSMLTGAVSVEPVTIVSPIFNTTLLMAAQLASGMTTVYQSSLISTQTDFIDR